MANNIASVQYIDCHGLKGTGARKSRYLKEVTGILKGIIPRTGTYSPKDEHGNPILDPKTGRPVIRPNSFTAEFEDGSMWSWPTYVTESGKVGLWTGFAEDIDVGELIDNRVTIHVWVDKNNFHYLEVVETKTSLNPTAPLPWEFDFDVAE